MFRLISLFPWPVMALLSALFFWMAQDGYKEEVLREAEKAEALMQGVPAPVAIDEFTKADVHLADEVHVTTWINTDHTYELTKTRKGTDTVRRMFVLFGPGDTPETQVARGVVVLHPVDVDAFLEQVFSTADVTDPRMVFSLLGQRAASPDLSDMVDDALDERGLAKDADFLVVEPYLSGRAAALAPDPDAPRQVATIFGVLGAIAALITLGKVAGKLAGRSRARQRAVDEPVLQGDRIAPPPRLRSQAAPSGPGYGTVPTPAVANTWSPLAAVMAKQAALDPSVVTKGYVAPAARIENAALAEPSAAAPRKGHRRVAQLGLAAALYAGLFLSFGSGTGPLSTASVGQMASGMMGALGQTDMPLAGMPDVNAETGALETAKQWAISMAAKVMPEPAGSETEAGPMADLPQVSPEPETRKDQVANDIAAGKTPAEAIAAVIRADNAGTGPVFIPPNWQKPAQDSGLFNQAQASLAGAVSGAANIQTLAISFALLGGAMALLAALSVARRARQRVVVARGDPWDRIAERLH